MGEREKFVVDQILEQDILDLSSLKRKFLNTRRDSTKF